MSMSEEGGPSVSLVELRQLIDALRRLWWIPLIAAAALSGLSGVMAAREPAQYRASTTLRVNQLVFGDDVGQSDLEAGRQLRATYEFLTRGDKALLEVKQGLGLDMSVAALRANVSVRTLPEAPLLVITVKSQDMETARRIAAEIGDVLVRSTPSSVASPNRQSQIERLDGRLAEVDAEVDGLQDRLSALSAEARQSGTAPDRLLAIQREARSTADIVETLEATYAELRSQRESIIPVQLVTIVEPATVSGREKRSVVGLNTVLAGLAGLFMGSVAAIALQAFDRRIRSPRDAEQRSGLEVLGTVFLGDPNEDREAAESFRMLRTRLGHALDTDDRHVIVVVGASPTTTAAQVVARLAFCIADAGITVAVVDANMRQPMQAALLGARRTNRPDLAGLLEADHIAAAPSLVSTSHPQVSALPVHARTHLPDLLVHPRMHAILDEVSQSVDVVLCDVPPGPGLADPIDVARHADAVVVVATLGETTSEDLNQLVGELVDAKATVLGVVLTGADGRKSWWRRAKRERHPDPLPVVRTQAFAEAERVVRLPSRDTLFPERSWRQEA